MERNFFVPASQWVQFCKLNPAGQAGRARDQVTDLLPLKALGSGLSGLGKPFWLLEVSEHQGKVKQIKPFHHVQPHRDLGRGAGGSGWIGYGQGHGTGIKARD